MALIMNIETSAEHCSVTLADKGIIIDSLTEKEERSHASSLAVLIDKIIQKNNLSINSLSAVAISQGPGSYTGLRIGTSTAKGICYGLDIPLIAVDTLQAMSWGVKQTLKVDKSEGEILFCPMLDARRMEIYTATYNYQLSQKKSTTSIVLDNETVEDFKDKRNVFFGSGIEKFKSLINTEDYIFIDNLVPHSDFLSELSFKLFQKNDFVDTAYFEPFYLKEFVATTPKKKVL